MTGRCEVVRNRRPIFFELLSGGSAQPPQVRKLNVGQLTEEDWGGHDAQLATVLKVEEQVIQSHLFPPNTMRL